MHSNTKPTPSSRVAHTSRPDHTSAHTTTTAVKPPPPVVVTIPKGSSDGLTTLLLSGAFLAAIIGAVVNTLLARRNTRLEERARVRTTLAEAYAAYAAYKEFPYAVRRRRADQPAEERVRLSEALREVQARLSYYQAWTLAESPATGAAYNQLVREVRRVAGSAMHDAWNSPPLADDAGMNIGPDKVDLSALTTAEERFIAAANEHVCGLTRSWPHRRVDAGRRLRHRWTTRSRALPIEPGGAAETG